MKQSDWTFYDDAGAIIGTLSPRSSTIDERVGGPVTIKGELLLNEPLELLYRGHECEVRTPAFAFLNNVEAIEAQGKRYRVMWWTLPPYHDIPYSSIYVYELSLTCAPYE